VGCNGAGGGEGGVRELEEGEKKGKVFLIENH
jgi:hypothetical protein